jgi:hypothetical protein
MNIRSSQSGHWTEDELLAFHYGIGPSGNHLDDCSECQSRLAAMRLNRERIENAASVAGGVEASFLAAQRRAIYQRMEEPVRWWNALPVRRWAAGVATACVLAGSLVVYEHNREAQLAQERISDAKLAQEVAMMAQDTGVSSMAPLEGLFE